MPSNHHVETTLKWRSQKTKTDTKYMQHLYIEIMQQVNTYTDSLNSSSAGRPVIAKLNEGYDRRLLYILHNCLFNLQPAKNVLSRSNDNSCNTFVSHLTGLREQHSNLWQKGKKRSGYFPFNYK